MNHSVIYSSAYYRGLSTLLDMWPKIRKEVPDATLSVYYGWASWDALAGPRGHELKAKILTQLEDLKDHGVSEYGRISHENLAKELKKAKVWAYPTSFHEIFCITAVKAIAAGCYPVTTGVAALKETQGGFGTTIECDNIEHNEYAQSRFVKAVVKALKDDTYDPEPAKKWALDTYSWENVSNQWKDVIK